LPEKCSIKVNLIFGVRRYSQDARSFVQDMVLNNCVQTKFEFPSDRKCRKDIVDRIFNEVSGSRHPVALNNEELYLIIDEAVTNAMEHGNHWDAGKHVMAGVDFKSDRVYITISDEGPGFNIVQMKNAMKNRSLMSKRGRGIGIISHLCDISWNDLGNRVCLSIKTAD